MKPTMFHRAVTEDLHHKLKRANTELAKKELFIQYLTKTFAQDAGAQALISQMSLGAEKVIANIPRGSRIGSGRADTQTETVIIEWERDLAKTGTHAQQQLEEYLEGNWRSGQEYRFILLATDGIRWRIYAPDWSRLEFGAFRLGANFALREIRKFDLEPSTFDEFPFFLDEILFATQAKLATLENIQADFGDTSAVFINSLAVLQECSTDIETRSELAVAFEQWRRFLSIAYGRFDDSPQMFLIHTYLSVFAKFIAYSVLTKRSITDDETIRGVLRGTAFKRLNVERFVEDDFFHWVGEDAYIAKLRPMFRELNRRLQEYNFSEIKEDILKGVYQELIDFDTRHALGEYYTPDWLCEAILEEVEFKEDSRILDPACGSGSFLRATVARIVSLYPDLSARALADQIVGIDIHPLSVQIAKTTMLLALGDKVACAREPIVLHVYLANSLLVPKGTANLFEFSFTVTVDNRRHVIDVRGMTGPDDFDDLITFCDDMVRRYEKPVDRERFVQLATPALPRSFGETTISQLYDVYASMKRASDEDRNTIWKFILQNSYKPVFLRNRFDLVVGNPPWLTFAGISNGEYQTLLLELADEMGVTPVSRANIPHLEIAAVFLAHSVSYFLKPSGSLVFVLPRSFFSADQHDNTRAGSVHGLQLTQAWDLEHVSPLFRVPCCVLFARPSSENGPHSIAATGLKGMALSGRLGRPHIHWADAQQRLLRRPTKYYYSSLRAGGRQTRSALTESDTSGLIGTNAYFERFSQGATIVPRNFFFVKLDPRDAAKPDLRESVVWVESANEESKGVWIGKLLSGQAEGKYLFRTAISRNLVPFALVEPPLILLPVAEEKNASGTVEFRLLDSETLLERGDRYASAWFLEAERLWDDNRTDRNRAGNVSLSDYLNWQKKLTDQKPDARYLVLYTSSSSDASAVVVDRREFDLPFVVDHKAYWCDCTSEAEALYLAGYINSNFANDMIKDFQSRGLFGPRDIHKTILKLPFPKFDKKDAAHLRLGEITHACARKAAGFLERGPSDWNSRTLGRVRSALRDQLSRELDEIDEIVSKLSTGRSLSAMNATRSRRGRRRTTMGTLFD